MAKVKTNVINVSGLTISETDEGTVKIKAKAGTKLAIPSVSSTSTRLVVNKSDSYVLEGRALFTGKGTDVSLFGSADDFDATSDSRYSAIKTINASATENELVLTGNGNANLIVASSGGSTLDGGDGNDTLTGGAGADTFIYQSGNDVIKNFSINDDTIQIDGVAVTDGSVSGSNVILKIGKETLTIEGMAKKELTFTDDDGTKIFKDSIFYDEDKTAATLASSFSKSEKIKLDVDTIDASNVKKGVYLIGNSSDNEILGGTGNDSLDGGAGDDTITGGKGNDSLWGGDGSDTFIYTKGDGKDVIFGFTSDDALTLEDIEFTSATVNKNGTEVTLKLGSGSVTFKNFSSGTEFNIGDSTYQVVSSGSKYSFEEV